MMAQSGNEAIELITRADIMPASADGNALASEVAATKVVYVKGERRIGTGLSAEDIAALRTELFVAQYATNSIVKLRLYDLFKLGCCDTYGDKNVPTGIIYSTESGLYIYGSEYDFNTRFFQCPAVFSKYCEHGSVLYASYGNCIAQLSADNRYFVVGENDGYAHKIDKHNIGLTGTVMDTAYGGAVKGICCLGDYVYLGGATTNKVWQVKFSDMTKQAESASYGGQINAVITDGTDVFAGGATTKKIYKYQVSDMSKLAESAAFTDSIICLTNDDTYIYAGCNDGSVYKVLKSDLSAVTSAASYTGVIYAILVYGSYLYIGGDTTKKIYQLLKSDLSLVQQSYQFAANIRGLVIGATP
jgi:hypothetical protein